MQISPFKLFLFALWWPLPFLPGLRWEDIIAPMGLTIFALIGKYMYGLPVQQPYNWEDLEERHRIPWKRLMLALIGLEAVLLLFIRIFGNGHEQLEPYAGWIAPFGNMLVDAIPKFTLMAGKLVEMGSPERVNVLVVAWAIAYLAQIALAAFWAPAFWRRLRERPLPPGQAQAQASGWRLSFARVACIVFAILLIGMAILHPEASELRGRRDLFSDFERRDVHLLYHVVFHSILYWQVAVLCLLFPIAARREQRLEPSRWRPLE